MTRHRLSFLLHRERSGLHFVTARLTCTAWAKVDVALGRSVPQGGWDRKRQRAVASSREAADLNLLIAAIERDVEALFTRAALDGRTPSRAEALLCLKNAAGRENTPVGGKLSTLDALALYTASQSLVWADGTRKKYRTLARHLADFGDRPLERMDAAAVEAFARNLIAEGMANASVTKYLKALRAFLRWAARSGHYHGDGDKTLPRLKDGGNPVVYLTIDELRRMETIDLQGTAAAVRDVFVFCCYTGLRFSDAARLRREDDHGDHIEVVTVKTGERVSVDLNRHARAILDRWRRGDKALPAISNQKSNEYLKTIAHACRIVEPVTRVRWSGSRRKDEVVEKWRLVTTHTARRTFVVTALTLGIPAEVVMRWTGHSGWEAMKPYVAIVEDLKRREMDKFDGI